MQNAIFLRIINEKGKNIMENDLKNVSRREFVITSGAVLGTLASTARGSQPAVSGKTRLAIVGTGSRGIGMWGSPAVRDYSDRIEMVGLCDINPKRVRVAEQLIRSNLQNMDGHLSQADETSSPAELEGSIPVFTDFDEMVRTTRPDRIIVTTMDSTHMRYVIRALELGCDVICEKPFATDEEQCQSIIDAQKKYDNNIVVTFNARYGVSATRVKEMLKEGAIGELYSVDYAEALDDDHGTSYFRRWHGIKENSGTLLVHKASHHFDQLNWWIEGDPVEVSAFGYLNRYGRKGPYRHANCRLCSHKDKCPFYWDITENEYSMKLYVDCESEDGYFRDGCVFRNAVNIYDTMSVQVRYNNKVLVTYSLNAGLPVEGQMITFNGSRGRIELRNYDQQPWDVTSSAELRLIRNFDNKDAELEALSRRSGSHGGSDKLIRDHIFIPESPDEMGHRAGARAGIMSAIIGIAAYRSIEKGQPVKIAELVDFS